MGKASLSYMSISEPKTETNGQSDLRGRSRSPEYARNDDSKQKVSLTNGTRDANNLCPAHTPVLENLPPTHSAPKGTARVPCDIHRHRTQLPGLEVDSWPKLSQSEFLSQESGTRSLRDWASYFQGDRLQDDGDSGTRVGTMTPLKWGSKTQGASLKQAMCRGQNRDDTQFKTSLRAHWASERWGGWRLSAGGHRFSWNLFHAIPPMTLQYAPSLPS